MRRATFLTLIVVALLSPRAIAGGEFDQLDRAWSGYLSKDDPAQFAMKIRSLCASPRALWGGGKDFFFLWSKEHCRDWFARRDGFTISHADVHLGNIGVYPGDAKLGELGFGLVDFDDACALPIEIDLLQACISLQLAAKDNQIDLSDAQRLKVCETVLRGFVEAKSSNETAASLLAENKRVKSLLKRGVQPYAEVLDGWIDSNGRFVRLIEKRGELREILRPAMNRADELADALAQAAKDSPAFAAKLRSTDRAEIRGQIKDVALRVRMGSAGSQGLEKILILMERPLRGIDSDAIIYVKQQVQSSAERAGAVEHDPRPLAQRAVEAIDLMTHPKPFLNTRCEAGGKSYLVSLKDPSDELGDKIASVEALNDLAHIVGTVLGAAHRNAPSTDVSAQMLDQRAQAYLLVLHQQYESLRSDPRAKAYVEKANRFIEESRRR